MGEKGIEILLEIPFPPRFWDAAEIGRLTIIGVTGVPNREDKIMRDALHLTIPFSDKKAARAIQVTPDYPPAEALAALGLPEYSGIITLHGGAANMEPELVTQVRHFLTDSLAPFAQQYQILIVDGGTRAGAMAAMGDARRAVGGTFPLVGVCPIEFIAYPGHPPTHEDSAYLDESHSAFILVEGGEFGVESDLLVGLLQAAGKPGFALIINGGGIVFKEIQMHAVRGNRVVLVQGSGRIADELAAPGNERLQELPLGTQLEFVDLQDPGQFREMLVRWLG
jgi:hypothetical protein